MQTKVCTVKKYGIKPSIPLFRSQSHESTSSIIPRFQYNAEKNNYICPDNFELKTEASRLRLQIARKKHNKARKPFWVLCRLNFWR